MRFDQKKLSEGVALETMQLRMRLRQAFREFRNENESVRLCRTVSAASLDISVR
jgi:hypothetical protein